MDEARSRFRPAGVKAEGVDFSDRVDGKRKSYKTTSRRSRILPDGTEELGDLSDDDDEESLERKIARLTREVEEAKQEHAKRQAEKKGADDSTTGVDNLASLSEVLYELSKPSAAVTAPVPQRAAASDENGEEAGEAMVGDKATYTVTYAPSYEQSHALAKAADFDRRLVMLEKGLGINSSSIPEVDSQGLPRAILPTLNSMEKQISTLAQASTANLDTISRRVRTLISEQEKLNEAREKAKTLREELGKAAPAPPPDDSEEDTKINALYAILPSIENLTPILPPLLDRLRSLKAIHSEAANAGETLGRIEQEQVEMAEELKMWREGLEKVEKAMQDVDGTVKGNVQVMEGWVKGLEERVAKLN